MRSQVDTTRILPAGVLERVKDRIHARSGRIENNHFTGQESAIDEPVHYFLRRRRRYNTVTFDVPHIDRKGQAIDIFRRINDTGTESAGISPVPDLGCST